MHTMMRRPLIGNFSWSAAGNVVVAACQWGMLVALARLGNAETVGAYTLALAVTAPVALLFEMQLRSVLATRNSPARTPGEFLAFRMSTGALQMAVFGGAAWFLDRGSGTWIVMLGVGFNKTVEGFSDILYGVQQERDRLDLMARSQMARGILYLVLLTAVLASGGTLQVGVFAMSGAALAILAFDFRNAIALVKEEPDAARSLRPAWNREASRDLFRTAISLGVSSMLISCYTTIPRYFLEWKHGAATLGYLAAMAHFSVPGRTIVEALTQACLPRLSRYWRSDDRAFKKLVLRNLAAAAGVGVVTLGISVAFGRPLLSLVYGSDFARESDVLVPLMLAAGLVFVCSVLGSALTASGHLQVQLPITLGVVGSVAALSALLIPVQGLRGVAWALTASSALWVLCAGAILAMAMRRKAGRPEVESASPPGTLDAHLRRTDS